MSRASAIATWKEQGTAVLFDFGGTLDADGTPWKERFFRLYLNEGVAVAPEQFDAAFYAADDALVGTVPPALSFRDTVRALADSVREALGVSDRAVAGRIANRFLADALEQLQERRPLLQALGERYRLGVVSNFYGNLATVCEDAGIRRFFRVVVDSGETGYVKPDPRIFHQAVEGLAIDSSGAVFVGDSLPRDMAGARAVGMPHIWLAGPNARGETPCCPGDGVIRSLVELAELLL